MSRERFGSRHARFFRCGLFFVSSASLIVYAFCGVRYFSLSTVVRECRLGVCEGIAGFLGVVASGPNLYIGERHGGISRWEGPETSQIPLTASVSAIGCDSWGHLRRSKRQCSDMPPNGAYCQHSLLYNGRQQKTR